MDLSFLLSLFTFHLISFGQVRELLGISQEYVVALTIEQARKDSDQNPRRQTELASYFTHCNLQPAHLMIALRLAMTAAYKIKNYIDAASFARRLIELDSASPSGNPQVAQKVKK